MLSSLEAALGPAAALEAPNFLACLGELLEQRCEETSAPALRKALCAKARDAFARAAAARARCLGEEHPATVAVAARARAK